MTRMESVRSAPDYGNDIRIQLLRRLIKAEGLEKSLGSKYPGTKRFGLEGGESLIPMLDDLIQQGGKAGIHEIVIGLAHRGRINVLVNSLGKRREQLFDMLTGRGLDLSRIGTWQEFKDGSHRVGVAIAPVDNGVLLPGAAGRRLQPGPVRECLAG